MPTQGCLLQRGLTCLVVGWNCGPRCLRSPPWGPLQRLAQACSHGSFIPREQEWKTQGSKDVGLRYVQHFCYILLVSASLAASPDSRNRKINSTTWGVEPPRICSYVHSTCLREKDDLPWEATCHEEITELGIRKNGFQSHDLNKLAVWFFFFNLSVHICKI